MATANYPPPPYQQAPPASGSTPSTGPAKTDEDPEVKRYFGSDFKFIFYAFKQSFVALAFLRLLSEKMGGRGFDDVLLAAVAAVIGTLLRYKTTRKILPKKVQALWEPLRKIRKTPSLKFKASLLCDFMSYAAFFRPVLVKMAFGKAGWCPIGVFLVQYLYTRWSLMFINFMQIFGPTNFVPTATLGWLEEHKFITQKDVWRCLKDPSHFKVILKQMAKRYKEYVREEKMAAAGHAAGDTMQHAATASAPYATPTPQPAASASAHQSYGAKAGALLGKAVNYAEDRLKKN